MTSFSICAMGENPAIKFNHEYGEFEFYIVIDPKDHKKLTYAASAKLTPNSGNKILSEATEQLDELASVCGYAKNHQLTMYDILQVLTKAKKIAG